MIFIENYCALKSSLLRKNSLSSSHLQNTPIIDGVFFPSQSIIAHLNRRQSMRDDHTVMITQTVIISDSNYFIAIIFYSNEYNMNHWEKTFNNY